MPWKVDERALPYGWKTGETAGIERDQRRRARPQVLRLSKDGLQVGESGESVRTWIDRSRRPRGSQRQTNTEMEERVLALRDAHPAWAAASCVPSSCERDDRLRRPARSPKSCGDTASWTELVADKPRDFQRSSGSRPRAVADGFQGTFCHEGWGNAAIRSRCSTITSRFSVGLVACDNERRDTVRPRAGFDVSSLRAAGIKCCMDNGTPWGNSGNSGGNPWTLR